MEIAFWSGRNLLGSFVDNLTDLEILFNSASPQVVNFFDNCFQRTPYCLQVNSVEWKAGQDFAVLALDYSKVDESEVDQYMKENVVGNINEKYKQNKQIILKMVSFGQIFQALKNGKKTTIGDLLVVLAKAKDSILKTEFVSTSIDYFYEEYIIWVII